MIGAPVLLSSSHLVEEFCSGYIVLDDWIKRRALANQDTGASRVYVIEAEGRVIGYYAIATGNCLAAEAPGKIRRNMPDPVPVMVLARLAIDEKWQRRGLGLDLLRDAISRTVSVARIAGLRALMVHAIDEKAAKFYEQAGFLVSPHRPLTYFLLLHPLPLTL